MCKGFYYDVFAERYRRCHRQKISRDKDDKRSGGHGKRCPHNGCRQQRRYKRQLPCDKHGSGFLREIRQHKKILQLGKTRFFYSTLFREFELANFCLPIILLLVAVIWTLSLLLIPDKVTGLVVAACMTVLVAFLVTSFSKTARTKFMAKLYGKISTNWAGGGIVVR